MYRRSGGHSYHSAIAGPIDSILNPNFDKRSNSDLPFASTSCGSCSNVCPVKIDINKQLWKWRQMLAREGHIPGTKKYAVKVASVTLSHPRMYRIAGKVLRFVMRRLPALVMNKLNIWYLGRDMPPAPKESFREWYKKGYNDDKQRTHT